MEHQRLPRRLAAYFDVQLLRAGHTYFRRQYGGRWGLLQDGNSAAAQQMSGIRRQQRASRAGLASTWLRQAEGLPFPSIATGACVTALGASDSSSARGWSWRMCHPKDPTALLKIYQEWDPEALERVVTERRKLREVAESQHKVCRPPVRAYQGPIRRKGAYH